MDHPDFLSRSNNMTFHFAPADVEDEEEEAPEEALEEVFDTEEALVEEEGAEQELFDTEEAAEGAGEEGAEEGKDEEEEGDAREEDEEGPVLLLGDAEGKDEEEEGGAREEDEEGLGDEAGGAAKRGRGAEEEEDEDTKDEPFAPEDMGVDERFAVEAVEAAAPAAPAPPPPPLDLRIAAAESVETRPKKRQIDRMRVGKAWRRMTAADFDELESEMRMAHAIFDDECFAVLKLLRQWALHEPGPTPPDDSAFVDTLSLIYKHHRDRKPPLEERGDGLGRLGGVVSSFRATQQRADLDVLSEDVMEGEDGGPPPANGQAPEDEKFGAVAQPTGSDVDHAAASPPRGRQRTRRCSASSPRLPPRQMRHYRGENNDDISAAAQAIELPDELLIPDEERERLEQRADEQDRRSAGGGSSESWEIDSEYARELRQATQTAVVDEQFYADLFGKQADAAALEKWVTVSAHLLSRVVSRAGEADGSDKNSQKRLKDLALYYLQAIYGEDEDKVILGEEGVRRDENGKPILSPEVGLFPWVARQKGRVVGGEVEPRHYLRYLRALFQLENNPDLLREAVTDIQLALQPEDLHSPPPTPSDGVAKGFGVIEPEDLSLADLSDLEKVKRVFEVEAMRLAESGRGVDIRSLGQSSGGGGRSSAGSGNTIPAETSAALIGAALNSIFGGFGGDYGLGPAASKTPSEGVRSTSSPGGTSQGSRRQKKKPGRGGKSSASASVAGSGSRAGSSSVKFVQGGPGAPPASDAGVSGVTGLTGPTTMTGESGQTVPAGAAAAAINGAFGAIAGVPEEAVVEDVDGERPAGQGAAVVSPATDEIPRWVQAGTAPILPDASAEEAVPAPDTSLDVLVPTAEASVSVPKEDLGSRHGSDGETLPDDWFRLKSPETGQSYYFNAVAQETQWEKPTKSGVDVVGDGEELPDGWWQAHDPVGAVGKWSWMMKMISCPHFWKFMAASVTWTPGNGRGHAGLASLMGLGRKNGARGRTA